MANSRRLLIIALGAWMFSAVASAQGCSQCRDTVSQTNPAQQQSYRTAIAIMLGSAVAVGGAGIVAVRRFGR